MISLLSVYKILCIKILLHLHCSIRISSSVCALVFAASSHSLPLAPTGFLPWTRARGSSPRAGGGHGPEPDRRTGRQDQVIRIREKEKHFQKARKAEAALEKTFWENYKAETPLREPACVHNCVIICSSCRKLFWHCTDKLGILWHVLMQEQENVTHRLFSCDQLQTQDYCGIIAPGLGNQYILSNN